ncbi:MAG TPA: hypothetical protein VH327_06030 [Gammaproteobacteria bacterium]|jgi:hypothetical protein|nr:hypothetical protein [Gammaproteobacteria bacterium]
MKCVAGFAATGLTLVLLAGCAAAPPATPILATGPLHGRLEKGIYYDRFGWFEIATPIAPTDPVYSAMSVDEESPPNSDYVSFLPNQTPEYYRVYVEDFFAGNHPLMGYGQIADIAVGLFGKQSTEARSEPVERVGEKPWHTATTSGLLRLYTQRTPLAPLLTNLGMAEDYTAYILMYVTSQKGKVAVLWMEWPMGCKLCPTLPPGPATASDDPVDKALAANGRASVFMDSFRFGND